MTNLLPHTIDVYEKKVNDKIISLIFDLSTSIKKNNNILYKRLFNKKYLILVSFFSSNGSKKHYIKRKKHYIAKIKKHYIFYKCFL